MGPNWLIDPIAIVVVSRSVYCLTSFFCENVEKSGRVMTKIAKEEEVRENDFGVYLCYLLYV